MQVVHGELSQCSQLYGVISSCVGTLCVEVSVYGRMACSSSSHMDLVPLLGCIDDCYVSRGCMLSGSM